MYTDARKMENGSVIEADICIIGAGAAGISVALEWMNTPYQVALLEGGGFDYEERMQELFKGKSTGQPYYPLQSTRLHYFGGTTGHWGGMCSIFDPVIFKKRDWIPYSGWPISQDDLIPYYDRAHANLDLGNDFSFDVDHWRKKDSTLVPMPFDKKVFWNKIWKFSPPTRFGSKYKDTIVNARNIHLYTYANVVNIAANENVSRVKEVTIKNFAGKTHTVRARYFVMACCAIQGARLLLSSNHQAPKGLGNDNDLVGRFFMEHAEIKSAEFWLKRSIPIMLYLKSPLQIRAELSLTPEKLEELRVLNGIMSLMPLRIFGKIPSYIKGWTHEDPREDAKEMREYFEENKENRLESFFKPDAYGSFQVVMRLEQAPNPLSRVTLDTEKDELGVPRADLNWAFTDLEKKSVRTIYEMLGQQAGITGLGRVKLLDQVEDINNLRMPDTTSGGWHHMGTTRMHEDPKQGVVDAQCKVHGIDNLYIASSSVFPNSAGVNPTMTIVAMSIRVADILKQKIKQQA